MARIVFAFALIVMLVSCAQNQVAGLRAGTQTTKNFAACGLSVRFSGEPEELRASEKSVYSAAFSKNPDGPVWRHVAAISGVTKQEVAFCVCPDEPMLSELRAEIIQGPDRNIFL